MQPTAQNKHFIISCGNQRVRNMGPKIYLDGRFNIVSSSQLNKKFKFEEMTKCFCGPFGKGHRAHISIDRPMA
jgi:hypothetical protein